MSIQIERVTGNTGSLNVTSNVATCDPVRLGTSAGGVMHCISTSTNGAITVFWFAQYAADSPNYKLADNANAAVTTLMSPGNCYEMPTALYGAAHLRIVASTAGQSAVVLFSLKG
jgi:hypothetical protein